jgi:hypothetical protein
MAKQKRSKKTPASNDGLFALKLALYVILGSLWVKVVNDTSTVMPLPVGLLIGMVLASHEHFQIDRKIEYAVLLVAALVGFLAPYGLYLTF